MIKEFINDNNYKILIDNKTISIKNYIRIDDLSQIKIKIKLNNKSIIINGNNLLINKLDKYDLKINGIIKEILFIDE